MGISRTTAQLIIMELKNSNCDGHIACLGRMHIYFTWDELSQMAKSLDYPLKTVDITLHKEPSLKEHQYISDDTFFSALGFSKVTRIDYNNYEDVEVILDLNSQETPSEPQNQFDFLLDSGTIEHVFHVPNLLANLHRMLKSGGRIFHLTPASNCLDHGFYCLSPTFFADYYSTNHYKINSLYLCKYSDPDCTGTCTIYDYTAIKPNYPFKVGQLDKRVYYSLCIVTKTIHSTCNIIPQQSMYVNRWSSKNDESSSHSIQPTTADRPTYKLGKSQVFIEHGCKADQFIKLLSITSWSKAIATNIVITYRTHISEMLSPRFPLPVKYRLK